MENKFERCKNYILGHRALVEKGFEILQPLLKDYLSDAEMELLKSNIKVHDESKFSSDEFFARVNYYHGEKSEENLKKLKSAEEKHKTTNPHHPEYWAAKNEEMPRVYIVEMVLDMWTFGLRDNNPREIFDFYEKNKDEMPLLGSSRKELERVLKMVDVAIDEETHQKSKNKVHKPCENV